ncbi:MAG: hypothetical protein ACRET4_13440 [Steroidobacteraceae bacterium]
MFLVNSPGDWNHVYTPLGHAALNGWTPTDLIVSLAYAAANVFSWYLVAELLTDADFP